MVSPTRTTIALDAKAVERMKSLSVKFDVSYARLVACLLNIPDEEVKRVLDENLGILFEAKRQARLEAKANRKVAFDAVKSMTPEQLAALIAAVKKEPTHAY